MTENRQLFIRKFATINVFVVFVIAVMWREGLVWPLFRDDSSHLSVLILAWTMWGLRACWCGKWTRVEEFMDDVVSLGLLGTVIGFAEALVRITPEAVTAGATAEMVGAFVQGARTALYTTIVGSCGNWWMRGNMVLLRGVK